MANGGGFSSRTLGLFARVLPSHFTHAGLDALFFSYDIDEGESEAVSKQKRAMNLVKMLRALPEPRRTELTRSLLAELIPRRFGTDSVYLSDEEEALAESINQDGWVASGQELIRAQPMDSTLAATRSDMAVASRDVDFATSRRVFIVHGRDAVLMKQVAAFVSAVGYEPVVLHAAANRGRTILEKFLGEASDAAFAVVLLTPDDEARIRGATDVALSFRARQNVVLEFGYFVALIGRDRVVALLKEEVELPSDLHGLLYVRVGADAEQWQAELLREMRAAGLDVEGGTSLAR